MDADGVDRDVRRGVRARRSRPSTSWPAAGRTPPVAPPEPGEALPEVRSTMADGMYQQAVEVAKEHILAGDIFQVVLAQRYDIDLRPTRSTSTACCAR